MMKPGIEAVLEKCSGWEETDKAALAGYLWGELDPSLPECNAFMDAAGETNCVELSLRIEERESGGVWPGGK